MKQLLVTSLLAFWILPGFSQSLTDFEKLREKYKKHNAVITSMTFDYLFDVQDDSLLIRQTNSKEMLILKEHAKMFTNDYIFFGGFTQISNKEAYSLIPEGKKYRKLNVEKYNESHDRNGSYFYDDSKTIQFSYPSVEEKAKTYVSYQINYNNPRFVRSAYLQSFIPVVHGLIKVKVHNEVKIGYKLFNNDQGKVNFKQYKKGKYTYYEWEIFNIEPYPYIGGNYHSISYYSPHVVLYVDETKIGGVKQNYFGAIPDLYNFYNGFIEQVQNENSAELQQLVDKITKGLSGHAKVKAIFYWVQQNIKYLAYEQGYMGFVPSPGTEVFKKRYGDCKGMTSLINEMMRLAGISGHYSWVGTRDIPYAYDELPLPSVDNHMITAFIDNDSVVLLDATDKFLDYGSYPYHIQEKEVLIGLDARNYRIFKVPVMPATYSVVTDSVEIRIENNSVKGNGLRIHKGFNKLELAYALDNVKEEDYKKDLSELFNKGNNKFKVESYSASHLFEHDLPARIKYGFSLPDYCRTLGEDIYVNMDLDKKYKGMKIDTSIVYAPIENDFFFTESFIYSLKIPEGYELDYVPKGSSLETKDFGYDITYTINEDAVRMKKVIRFEFLVLLEDKFDQWNDMIKQLNKQYRSTVVLKKIK